MCDLFSTFPPNFEKIEKLFDEAFGLMQRVRLQNFSLLLDIRAL